MFSVFLRRCAPGSYTRSSLRSYFDGLSRQKSDPRGLKSKLGRCRKPHLRPLEGVQSDLWGRNGKSGRGIYLVSSPLKPPNTDLPGEKSKLGRSGRSISSHLKLPKSDLQEKIACWVGPERFRRHPEAKIVRPPGRKSMSGRAGTFMVAPRSILLRPTGRDCLPGRMV